MFAGMFAGFTWAACWAFVLGFLRSQFGGIIMAAAFLLASGGLLGVVVHSVTLRGELKLEKVGHAQAVKSLAQCRSNVLNLEGSLVAQNRAVEALKAEGDARTAAAEKALSEARAQTVKGLKTIERLRAAKPGPDQCQSAKELIVETLRAGR